MNRRTKIIVSVAGIFVVLMALLGFTYAYFLTRINGNTNEKSISVTSANLELDYSDGNGVVTPTSEIYPGYTLTKTFTAENKGSSSLTYIAVMENIVNELTRRDDLTYKLECTSYLKEGFSYDGTNEPVGTVNGTCEGVEEGIFPSTGDFYIMAENTIETTQIHLYKLTVNYKEMNEDQSVDMGKNFSAKVNIADPNSKNPFMGNKKSLAYNIVNNALHKTNGTELVGSPLTSVANEISKVSSYKETSAVEATVEKQITSITGGTWYYYTGYTVDKKTGKFTLTGKSSCTYSECFNDLAGKYLYGTTVANNTTEQTNITDLENIYKVKSATETTLNYVAMWSDPDEAERELGIANDGGGVSYYYRGDVQDNYVDFAGMCWRIVRIQSDGSIKLILEDQDNVCAESDGNWDIPTETGGTVKKGNFGYTSGLVTNSSGVESITNKTVMNYLNPGTNSEKAQSTAYYNFQTTGVLKDYLTYLKPGGWCLDDKAYADTEGTTPLSADEIKDNYYNGTKFYYDSGVRLKEKAVKEPTYICNGTVMDKFGDGTTEMYVATLTADEIVYAGGKHASSNFNYFLMEGARSGFSGARGFNTLSPTFFDGTSGYAYAVNSRSVLTSIYVTRPTSFFSFRPAVSLASGAEIVNGGDGTKTNAYSIRNVS